MEEKTKIIKHLIKWEFFDEQSERNILHFLLNENIRQGEYEGNEYILKKISCDRFVLFREYIMPDTHIDRTDYILLSQEEFVIEVCKITGKSRDQLFDLAKL